jgi:hypothetical protein
MAVSLLQEFEAFFTEPPPAVRSDLWFMMVMMSGENLVFDDPAEACEREARAVPRSNPGGPDRRHDLRGFDLRHLLCHERERTLRLG